LQAVESAVRLVKEGGVDAVKLEGGAPSRVSAARAIVEAGIAVMGHVGLTPQAISVLGGFRAQGKTVDSALKVTLHCIARRSCVGFLSLLHLVAAVDLIDACTAYAGRGGGAGFAGGRLLRGCPRVRAFSGSSSCDPSTANPNHRHRGWISVQWPGLHLFHTISIKSC
jgi:hypothetical protein